MADKKSRYDEIDIMKGIGIILVVIGHAFPPMLQNENSIINSLKYFIYNFHMPLYFAISGFLFYKTTGIKSAGSFLKKKFVQLIVPYMVYSVLSYLVIDLLALTGGRFKSLLNSQGYYYKSPLRMIYEIVTYQNHMDRHLWFIYTLFILFVFAVLIESIRAKKQIVLCLLLLISLSSYSHFIIQYDLFRRIMNYMFFFYTGKVFAEGYDRRGIILKYGKVILSMFILINVLIVYIFNIPERSGIIVYASIVLLYPCGILGILSIYNISVFLKRYGFDRMLKYISCYSYDIYLIHQPFIVSGGIAVLYRILGVPVLPSMIISSLLGIIMPILISRYIIRKNNVLKFLLLGDKSKLKNKIKLEVNNDKFHQVLES